MNRRQPQIDEPIQSKVLGKSLVAASEPESTLLPQLIEDHQTGIWRYLRALGCSAEEADDLTQETFLAVFRRPFQYLGRPAAASYLRHVAHHLFLNYLRDKRSRISLRDVDLVEVPGNRRHSGDCHEEVFEVLAECFANLPERSRRCLDMRYREGFSRQEIAAALRISEHGAKNVLQRAKQSLRESIERRRALRDRFHDGGKWME